MKRLLFHSYHFPPIGGSGAQRPLKMARYLLEHGFHSTVVTGGGATADRWAPEDRTLDEEIPEEIDVLRVPREGEPNVVTPWRGRAERWLRVPSAWGRWWVEGSVERARDAAARSDLIYCWMQPYVSAEAAARLSADAGKPWVADLGDPWALDEMMVFPSALHQRAEQRRMGRLLASASAIVMSTDEAATRLVETFPNLRDRPVLTIPNGFDGTDFEAPAPVREDRAFRIVHTGYLHSELGLQLRRSLRIRRHLGGYVRGLDIYTRSHAILIEALGLLFERDPRLRATVELHLAGVLNETDIAIAELCPAAVLHGYVTHAESISLMRSADLLFLPMQALPAGRRATIVPGKTYEYLASGRPILGAVPEGDARDILEAAGSAVLCRPDDRAGIAAAVAAAVSRAQAGAPPPQPDPTVVARFEYRRLAGQLAGVFDDVLARA